MSNTEHSASVGWVPLYHDMGLIMGVMQPLYLGATSVLMAPAAFMQRPLNWLRLDPPVSRRTDQRAELRIRSLR